MSAWTKEPPTVLGWYWWRSRKSGKPMPSRVGPRRAWTFYGHPWKIVIRGRYARLRGEWWTTPMPEPAQLSEPTQ